MVAEATAKMSEKQLIDGVRNGSSAAFEATMRRHNRRLFQVARPILNDDADAEEALQESYIIAYQSKRERVVVPFESIDSSEEGMIASLGKGV